MDLEVDIAHLTISTVRIMIVYHLLVLGHLQAEWWLNSDPIRFMNVNMTPSNGTLFRVTGPFWRESIGAAPGQTVAETLEATPVIWDAIALIMTSF